MAMNGVFKIGKLVLTYLLQDFFDQQNVLISLFHLTLKINLQDFGIFFVQFTNHTPRFHVFKSVDVK